MMNNPKNSFVWFNYKPFDKNQCIKRLIFIWLLSVLICFIGNNGFIWLSIMSLFCVFVSVLFITLIKKYASSAKSRFLCDGVTCLYIAIILDIAAYRLLMIENNDRLMVLLCILLLPVISIITLTFIVCRLIKHDKYSDKQTNSNYLGILALGGTVLGMLIGRFLFSDMQQKTSIIIIVVVLMFISVVVSFGSVNLLKVICYNQLYNQNTGDGTGC